MTRFINSIVTNISIGNDVTGSNNYIIRAAEHTLNLSAVDLVAIDAVDSAVDSLSGNDLSADPFACTTTRRHIQSVADNAAYDPSQTMPRTSVGIWLLSYRCCFLLACCV